MKKIVRIFLLIFVVFTVFSINLQITASSQPSLIVTNPGVDSSTEMNISYHTTANSGLVRYYEAPDGIENYTPVECRPLPFDDMSDTNQCYATLTGLYPDTEYKYNVVGTNMEERSFKTAGTDGFSFVHVTDIHSYLRGASNTRVTRANSVLNKMLEIEDYDFVLLSGDATAYGTVYHQWEELYRLDVLKSKMLTITPGNHDYYNSAAQVTNISYFNSIQNSPKNGAAGVEESSFYFKYGNTLFISLNSEAAANSLVHRANQREWLNEVTANNPADFVIAFTHRPFYTGDGQNHSQAVNMRTYFQDIIDNTGVDLVLSGHNHVWARTYQIYDGQKIEGDSPGTTYVTGMQIGDRHKTSPGTKHPEVVDSHYNEDGGTLITVTDEKITLELITVDGTRRFYHEIYSKTTNLDADFVEATIKSEKVDDTIEIEFIELNPGLVKKIELFGPDGEELITYLNPTTNILKIENAPKVDVYNLNLQILLRDGKLIDKDIQIVDDDYDYGSISNFEIEEKEFETILKWDSELNPDLVNRLEIYHNGVLLKTLDLNEQSTVLDLVSPYKLNYISFKVIGHNNHKFFEHEFKYGEEAEDLGISFGRGSYTMDIGETYKLEYAIYPEQEVNLFFRSSNPEIASVDENGIVHAHKTGEAIITMGVPKRWDIDTQITITVNEPPIIYNIVFLDKAGDILKSLELIAGSKITAPTPPKIDNYKFIGWDQEFDRAESDLTISPIYEEIIIEYKVTFLDKDGVVLKEETIVAGLNATAPTPPEIEGYTFSNWDLDFTNVQSDLTITAIYEELPDEIVPEEPKGCLKSSFIFTGIAVLGLTFLFRRRK